MNDTQRLLVVASLVAIGLVLAIVFLEWGDVIGSTRILVFYERPDPRFPGQPDPIGLHTRYGIAGIMLGLIAPLFLFAAAAFVALGAARKKG